MIWLSRKIENLRSKRLFASSISYSLVDAVVMPQRADALHGLVRAIVSEGDAVLE